MNLNPAALTGVLISFASSMIAFADQPLRPERALSWQPKDYPEATLHARVAYLEPAREWERMDIWVPEKPSKGKLPCVVLLYGGGYGEKQGGFINDARPLLSRGFVLAAPDYALHTNAPVPLCSWDVANAIRFLRAHAERFRIDPERIGVWGWSAGGWIAQDLCYAGPERIVHAPTKIDRQKVSRWFPMIEPNPQLPDQSVRVQVVVTDWGAGKLWNKRTKLPAPWLSPDDPPLFTCYNGEHAIDRTNPVMLLRNLGVPSRAVYGIQGNTHVPNLKTKAVHEDGRQTRWGEAIYDFLETQLKAPDTATAPEILPHGGPLAGPTEVRLLTVHSKASIHYTLDGTDPGQTSPRYIEPLTVNPGQTLRAITTHDRLKPSPIATASFAPGPERPSIKTVERMFEAELGKTFRVVFEADHATGASWFVGGKTGEQYREFSGQRFNPPRHIPWMRMDAKTGILSGTPRTIGRFPVIVSCMAEPTGKSKHPQTGDAILVVIRVKRKAVGGRLNHTSTSYVSYREVGSASSTAPRTSVTAGELIVERPTLICLGFEWRIEGDTNHNATATVQYRKKGTVQWCEYLPLYRIGKGREVEPGYGNFGDPRHKPLYRIPEGLAGSIMDLQPATTYEVRLELQDPDEVKGEAVRMQTLTTRAEPRPFAGGEVRHVYPPAWKGAKKEPAYKSIMHAVNGFHPWCDNYQTIHPNRARPGTVVKVHAGTYKSDFTNYRDKLCLWLHGTRTLVADGQPDRPIAIVAAGDGDVVIDCAGADVGFNIMAADYLHFEGLTVRNTRIAFHGGFQGVMGCKGLTVKRCRLEQVQYGVLAQDGRSTDFTITDNVILGRNPSDRFNPESGGAWGRTKAGYAVNLAGQGHVVCYNRCENFWDVLNVFTNCLADPQLGQQARAIDFYNNDLFNVTDNFIETDGGYANIRVLRNRCFNGMAAPLSIQPVYAGPVYWIRNVVYNAHKGARAFKLEAGVNDNVICFHNTLTNHWTNAGGLGYGDIRNNLFMGPGDYITERDRTQGRTVLNISFQGPHGVLDHNAHRVGMPVEKPFVYKTWRCESLAALAEATGHERHGVEVRDYSEVFVAAEEPEHAPNNKGRLYRPREVDLRLKPDSPVIDAGCRLPGINDHFTGKAPDLGAYEIGKPLPHYGPRDTAAEGETE